MAPAGAAGADRRTAVVYLVKAFVGPGCLALPLAFRHAGLGLGAVLLLCLSAAVRHNMHSLVACKRHAGAATYPDLARRALGHKWRAAAEALVNVVQLGICAVYFDFFAETTLALLPAAVRPGGAAAPRLFMVAVAPCYAALALLRSVEAIAPYAALANALVFCAIAVVLFAAAARVGRAAQAGDFAAAERWARPGRAPLFYATVVYSFEGICSLLPLENALAEPADMRFVIDAGLAVVVGVYTSVGVFGFVAWPDVSSGSIVAELLRRADSPAAVVAALAANVATLAAVMLTFPVQLLPALELLELRAGFRPLTPARAKVPADEGHVELCDRAHKGATPARAAALPAAAARAPAPVPGDTTPVQYKNKGYTSVRRSSSESHLEPPSETDVDDDDAGSENPLTEDAERHLVADRRPAVVAVDCGAVPPAHVALSPQRAAFRVGVVLGTGLVAATVPDLGTLIMLVGAATGSMLTLVFPALIDLSVRPPGQRRWERVADVFIVVLGATGAVLGTTQTILGVFSGTLAPAQGR